MILDEILQEAKARVREVVAREMQAPIEHMKYYDQYEALITKKVGLTFLFKYLQLCLVRIHKCD